MDFQKILDEVTVAGDVAIPDVILGNWNKANEYNYAMKQKFSWYSVWFKDKDVTRGHKGQMTKTENRLIKSIEDAGLDVNKTIAKLYNLCPPRMI